jgi:hypothetical protein
LQTTTGFVVPGGYQSNGHAKNARNNYQQILSTLQANQSLLNHHSSSSSGTAQAALQNSN